MSPSLDLSRLQALLAVSQQGSFAAAAKELKLSVAAISLRVKALEEDAGQVLLWRGRPCKPTHVGQQVLAKYGHLRLLEQDLARSLAQSGRAELADHSYTRLSIAVNADSIASWVLPNIGPMLLANRLLADVTIEDQEHSLSLLRGGTVVGCVSTEAKAQAGCEARPLGVLRYRCVASKAWLAKLTTKRRFDATQLVQEAAVCFNRKDRLQERYLAHHFGLRQVALQSHFFPATDAFHEALLAGLGWGMSSEPQVKPFLADGRLIDLFPRKPYDVPLYWHHWRKEPNLAALLTEAIVQAAKHTLRP